MNHLKMIPALAIALLSASAVAQTAATETQRDVNQQQRIENGLKSGQLTTREAARLERREARINRAEAKAMKDGSVSDQEKAKIAHMQNETSAAIKSEKHDAQTGNPDSASSQRMQADVQRNVNQEKRIDNGLQTGALTTREAGRMERGQARIDAKEAAAGRDGHVGMREQRRVQRSENHQSHRIFRNKHDRDKAG